MPVPGSHPLRATPTAAPYSSAATGYHTTALLVTVFAFSLVDRQILSLLIEPIKRNLRLSDTSVSLLIGLSFAVFYGLFGLLLGRVADRWNRQKLILISLGTWTLATAAGAFASSVVFLFLARMMVGVGESSPSPAATSMVGDLFPPDRRARPLSMYFSGAFIGGGLALIVGGWVIGSLGGVEFVTIPLLGSFRPWQLTFLIVAAPELPPSEWLFRTSCGRYGDEIRSAILVVMRGIADVRGLVSARLLYRGCAACVRYAHRAGASAPKPQPLS